MNIRTLYVDNNEIENIKGLERLPNLRRLFIENNKKMSE